MDDLEFTTETEFTELLLLNRDEKYAKFNETIVKPKLPMIGVRAPILKRIAKTAANSGRFELVKGFPLNCYERCLIEGLMLGYLKTDFDILVGEVKGFIPKISDWAVCDMTCGNLKAFKKNEKRGFDFCAECVKSNNPWEVRFGLVLILSYYKKHEIGSILNLCEYASRKYRGKTPPYYVYMANGWLISVCFLEDAEAVFDFLKENRTDKSTKSAAIQKIIDSKRVGEEDKQRIKTLKKQYLPTV